MMEGKGLSLKFDTWLRAIIIIIIHFLTTPEFYNPLSLKLGALYSRKRATNSAGGEPSPEREDDLNTGHQRAIGGEGATTYVSQNKGIVPPGKLDGTEETSLAVGVAENRENGNSGQADIETLSTGDDTEAPSIADESEAPSLAEERDSHSISGETEQHLTDENSSQSGASQSVQEDSSSAYDVYMRDVREASTLTEVHNREDLPEVALLSLLEEQIPRYILRADTLTDFAGYDNADWVRYPCLPPDAVADLSPPLIAETLKYFTLCGERVSQMTRTYNDIEAVTRLLEEKERDLELAARIGQTLLEKNRDLENKNEDLEDQLQEATEKLRQLKYEISLKDDLLKIYVQDYEGDEDSTSDSLDVGKPLPSLDSLQKKVRNLEEENEVLRSETSTLRTSAFDYEEKEEQLVSDICQQLADNQVKLELLTHDLSTKSDVNVRQQEEITELLTKVITFEGKVKKLTLENADLSTHLSAAQNSQRNLTTELAELQDKYEESLALVHEQAEDLKALRRHHGPRALRHHFSTFSPMLPSDSLASELESSIRKYPEGYSPEQRKSHNRRVMETAKFVRRAASQPVSRSSSFHRLPGSSIPGSMPVSQSGSAWNSSSGNESCESVCGSSNRSSLNLSDAEGSDGYHGDTDSLYGSGTASMHSLGRPGLPGSNDLEMALKRLSYRQSQKDSALRESDESSLQHKIPPLDEEVMECHTPDTESMMSTGSSSHVSDFCRLSSQFRLPEKLQIVKPMEGSLVLHQWQRLATPHLGGLFEERPGVSVKGERHLDLDAEIYTLSDIEEDDRTSHLLSSDTLCLLDNGDDPAYIMGKCSEKTSSTFTYTTAKIMHPSDEYNTTITSSASGARMSTGLLNTGSQRKATSTFSMSTGLARMLCERGIRANPDLANNPGRFDSIVSETICSTVTSTTGAVYTQADLQTRIGAISMTARPLLHPDFTALFEKVKDIGLQRLSAGVPSVEAPDGVKQSSDCDTDTETITGASDSETESVRLRTGVLGDLNTTVVSSPVIAEMDSIRLRTSTVPLAAVPMATARPGTGASTGQSKVVTGVLSAAETSAAVSDILNKWKSNRRKVQTHSPLAASHTPPIRELPSYFAPIRDLPHVLRTITSGGASSYTTTSPQTTQISPSTDAFSPLTAEPPPVVTSEVPFVKLVSVASQPLGSVRTTPATVLSNSHSTVLGQSLLSKQRQNSGLIRALSSPSDSEPMQTSVSVRSQESTGGILHGLNMAASKLSQVTQLKSSKYQESDGVNIMRQEFYNDPNIK